MRKFTHLIVGLTVGVVVSYFYGRVELLYMFVGAFMGIAPDFDIIPHKLGLAKHRGVYSHSLLSSIVISILVFAGLYFGLGWGFVKSYPVAVVSFGATFLHTAADSLNLGGTRLFYPIYREKIRGRMKYDDWLYNGLLVLLCIVLMAYLTQKAILSLIQA